LIDAGKHDRRNAPAQFIHLGQHFKTTDMRHMDVEDQKRGTLRRGQAPNDLLSGIQALNVVTARRKEIRQIRTGAVVVVHYPNPCLNHWLLATLWHFGASPSRATGL